MPRMTANYENIIPNRMLENSLTLSLPPRIKYGINSSGSPGLIENPGFLLLQE